MWKACLENIQEYSEPCVTSAYSEPWHIQNERHMQNLGIFRREVYSEPEANSEPCQTFMTECCAKIVNNNSCFHKL